MLLYFRPVHIPEHHAKYVGNIVDVWDVIRSIDPGSAERLGYRVTSRGRSYALLPVHLESEGNQAK